MKKVLFLLILLLFPLYVYAIDLDIESKSAILFNRTNGEILYSKNEEDKLPIASLTKIMTSIITLENIKSLDEEITITEEDLKDLDGYVKVGLSTDMTISYKDLIYSLIMYSAADSANALANHVFDDYNEFINQMNSKASKLDMNNTHFSNPIGKDIDNYSTSKDMYILLDYALNNKNFYDIYTKKKYTLKYMDKTIRNNINNSINKNNIENKNNIKILGSKSGYTNLSGLSLTTLSKLDENDFILITLDAMGLQDTYKHLIDQLKILNYFKDNYSNRTILKKNVLIDTIIYKDNKDKEINYSIKSNKEYKYYLPNDLDLNYIKVYYDGLVNIDKNINNFDKLGNIYIYLDDKLLASEEVLFNKINLVRNKKDLKNILIIILVCLFSLIVFKKKKKKN